ncbi:amino acid/amide ABC transporter substrate-binding protein (HAAT family) [Thermodesulfitimonas autotrophica]|uniref:Amino acid/amide ABC transporter substrate-binding protein (HAAT family) n=1 Tax=Thermodesulfitimonas autotrophica TaxID=1894989 RepID=A0A3N5AEN5_9THEO|nr:ABC transporter substrate-binding protein [Thermodesulfitimonas autotrophica]RPF42450.1 amino acid/amide ABC transporter substrate-binding protein (HAAT family) [Thermodesulfitimonas autotrophica]
MKRSLFLVCLLTLLVLAGGCGKAKTTTTPAATKAQKEPYTIGAILDTSGPAASLGEPERDTLQMVVEELNAKGGIDGHPVELILLDNKSSESEAVLAAKRLVNEDKVLAIIGCSQTGTSLAIVDTVTKAQVPMISVASSAKIVTPPSERRWIFKTTQNNEIVAQKMIAYLKQKGIKDVAVLSVNNAYGRDGAGTFIELAAKNGINVVLHEKFEATDTDMTAQLAKVKASPAKATAVFAIPPAASIVTKNFRDLGLQMPLLHCHGIGNKKFLELAGDAANGVVAPMGKLLVAEQLPDNDPQKQVLLKFIADYQKKYHVRPTTFSGHAYDAFYLLVNAIKQAGPDRAKIRDALEQTTGFVGVSGVFNMSAQDHSGLGEDAMVLVEVKDGKWHLLQ